MELIDYPLSYRRHKTRVVPVGNIAIGGDNPICIQSMLTSATTNVADCLQEIRSLNQVGCQLIRLAIPSRKDLDAIPEIRRQLYEEGINIPLVADIHYSPLLAVDACEIFDKIRINPGNYSDRPKTSKNQNDGDYFSEGHLKLKEAVKPLAKNLKKYNRALRIGVNQGSLSYRMMEKYGDSPLGMVHSALEMITLFEQHDVFQLIVSLKSSNPLIVQKAYRLLVAMGPKENAVSLHLGVTEAGNEIMGRIKSLVGIGSLLIDGIGDTIRVSLTEQSKNEVIFARELLKAVDQMKYQTGTENDVWQRPLDHLRIKNQPLQVGGTELGAGSPLKIGQIINSTLPKTEVPVDTDFTYDIRGEEVGVESVRFSIIGDPQSPLHYEIPGNTPAILIDTKFPLNWLRKYFCNRNGQQGSIPVGMIYPSKSQLSDEIQIGTLLSEGLLDFMLIPVDIESVHLTRMQNLLQAARARILITEYITCPSCARTLFDIESTVADIKQRTQHLKGLKIGVMGCIVNGPGEMADADFGYVGSGNGKIDLYFGQQKIQTGIDEADAVDRLVGLIKEKGRWQ